MVTVNWWCIGEPRFASAADKPMSVNVTEGDQLRLPCRVTAEPVADINWYRNGEPIDREFDFTYFCNCNY